MRRITLIVLALAASMLSLSLGTYAAHQQIPVVRLVSEAQIAASPVAVWSHMTTGKNLVTWCPVWKSPSNARIVITKVGDVLDFTDEYGNGGRSVVTYLEKNKELRVSHEPNNGSYLCQAKLVLTSQGGGTRVQYTEQYTDESAPADMEATAKKTEAEMAATLAALKSAVEKK